MMANDESKNGYKKFLFLLAGLFLLMLGMSLILSWCDEVIILFKGSIGLILAGAGLFTLYALNRLK